MSLPADGTLWVPCSLWCAYLPTDLYETQWTFRAKVLARPWRELWNWDILCCPTSTPCSMKPISQEFLSLDPCSSISQPTIRRGQLTSSLWSAQRLWLDLPSTVARLLFPCIFPRRTQHGTTSWGVIKSTMAQEVWPSLSRVSEQSWCSCCEEVSLCLTRWVGLRYLAVNFMSRS
jgi:hypothetical protein